MKVCLLLLVLLAPLPALAGGSGWSYFVSYDRDPAVALDKLRWDVFRRGDYYKPNPKRKAKSPDHALALSEEEGTHSIIDIRKVAREAPASCAAGTVCPLGPAALVELFGSERPDRAKVEAAGTRLTSRNPAWSGLYVVVYEANAPKWLFFAGHSGD
jgi:hypothetical protein